MITVLNGAGNLTFDAPADSSPGVTLTISKPANIADGDMLVAVITFQNTNGTPSVTYPAGWTQVSPPVGLSPLRPSGIYVLPVPSAAALSGTSSWQWSTNVAAGRRRGMIFRVTGADLTTQPDVYSTWATTAGTTSVELPGVTTTVTNTMLIATAHSQSALGLGQPAYTPPGGMTSIATINVTPATTDANTGLWAGYEARPTPGATGNRTITMSPAATNSGGFMVALRSADSVIQPSLLHNIAGAVSDTSFQIAYKTANVLTGVRAVVSTASDLSNPVYSSSSVPDGAGYGHITVSGLTADTQYYWGLELDGAVSPNFHGATRTFPSAGTQASFSFLAASCVNTGDNPTTLDSMRTRTGTAGLPARFFSHLGDFHYLYSSGGGNPIAPEDQAVLRENYSTQIELSRHHQLYREIPLSYTWSDVDSFGSNGDGTYAANNEANAAYRQVFPVPTDMPATSGLYRSWVIGRIRFIQMDQRTFSSAIAATDNSSKTKLGTTQKAWLLNLIQTATEQVIVMLGDSAWFGPVNSTGNNDSWGAYSTERAEIGSAIAASGKNCIYIHGDIHALAADDGTNNQWGGFPIVCAAPISRPDMSPWPTGAGGTWTVSSGSFPSSSQAGKAYGWFDITDTGNQITLEYSGYESEIERVSMTVTWDVSRWQRGDGTKLVPYVKISNSLIELQ